MKRGHRKGTIGGASAAAAEAVPASSLLGSRLNLHRLDIFVSVAQTGSMSAAAEKFGLTQPAVSQAIRKLEELSGFELFDRSIRPPKLTLRGATFLNDAMAVVESIRRLEVGVRFGESAPLPTLRIGMLNSFASTLGPFVIKALQDSAVHWYVDTGFAASRIITLLDRRFDFIITADETKPPPGVIATPLFSEPYRIVLPSSLHARTDRLVKILSEMNMIRFGRDPNMMSRIDHWLSGAGIQPPKRYHLDTIEGTVQMVSEGIGWSLLPPLAVFRLIERGEAIKTFKFPGKAIRRTVSMVSREGEGVHIAERIRSVAVGLLKERYLPSVKNNMPDALADIVIS
jgi:DNA-binding transcriptional LysR family regulator